MKVWKTERAYLKRKINCDEEMLRAAEARAVAFRYRLLADGKRFLIDGKLQSEDASLVGESF